MRANERAQTRTFLCIASVCLDAYEVAERLIASLLSLIHEEARGK